MKQKVLVNKEHVLKQIQQRIRLYDVPAPELSEQGIQVLRVKLASLDDQIKASHLASAPIAAMLKMYRAIMKGEPISQSDLARNIVTAGLNPKTEHILSIFSDCVVEPSFTFEETELLSQAYPELVNRVVAFALKSNESGVIENG